MGREIKRLALDFGCPLGETWDGYLNPHYVECAAGCEGGYSKDYKALEAKWYGYAQFTPEERGSVPFMPDHPAVLALAQRNTARVPTSVAREARRLCALYNGSWSRHLCQADVDALVEAGRLRDLTHTWSKDDGWQPRDPPHHPNAAEVNEWSLCGFGHDSTNAYIVICEELKRLGLPHACPVCNGSGMHQDHAEAYEAWEPTEPPEGDGYQVWQAVSEGGPVSPVFAEPEDLADWMIANDTSITSDTSREQWLTFIRGPGWAPSMIMQGGALSSGVAAVKP